MRSVEKFPTLIKDNGDGTVTEKPVGGSPQETIFGDFTPGRYAWELQNIQLLPSPIFIKGHQGLWNFDMENEAAKDAAAELPTQQSFGDLEDSDDSDD